MDLFNSFWMAGFECSDQLNNSGNRVDLLHETRHLENIYTDYSLLGKFGIKTVREGIRWSKVEYEPYQYDFSDVIIMLDNAEQFNIQIIWDICHFGFPDDLSPLHPHFNNRFVSLCKAFVGFNQLYKPNSAITITPINEVGFISWLGGEVAGTSPYSVRMGWEVKYALAKAYINGIKAMKEMAPEITIMVTEPLVNIVPPLNSTMEKIIEARKQHEIQYQVVDMLTGAICEELGGQPDLVDIIGLNFYYNNQWIVGTDTFLPWANEQADERWRPLSSMFVEVAQRYQKPIVLAETSHPGIDRPKWIKFITKECQKAIAEGVDMRGICLYPIIDRPDWDNLNDWHHAGLWDSDPQYPSKRILYLPYAKALHACQGVLPQKPVSGGVELIKRLIVQSYYRLFNL